MKKASGKKYILRYNHVSKKFHTLYLCVLNAHVVLYDEDGYFNNLILNVQKLKSSGAVEEKNLMGKTHWRVNHEIVKSSNHEGWTGNFQGS